MALLKYFKPTKVPTVSTLPLPSRPFSEVMPSSSIEAANMEVKSIILESQISSENDAASTRGSTAVMKRGPYVRFSQQAKVSVVKYTSKHGVVIALRHYIKKFLELKESTIRTWRNFMSLNCNKSKRFKMTHV